MNQQRNKPFQKPLIAVIALLSLYSPASKALAQIPPCNYTFQNFNHCAVNIQVDITCGGTTYTYQGSAASANCGSPQNTMVSLVSSLVPTSCDFSGCSVTVTVNGQTMSGTIGGLSPSMQMDVECNLGQGCSGGYNKMTVRLFLTAGTSGNFSNFCCN